MIKKNEPREPLYPQRIGLIVVDAAREGTDDLKSRVTAQVIEALRITDGKLPDRVRTWIHQYCMSLIGRFPQPIFNGKVSEPIDLASLPNRTK